MNKIIIPFTILILVAFATMGIGAQVKAVAKKPCKEFTISNTKSNVCRNPEKLDGLCSEVFDRTEDSTPKTPFKYAYQRRILEASGAIEEKDEEVVAFKVRKMWSECEDKLTCKPFDTPGGSLIKYGVFASFDSFVEDIWSWGIDLNRIDSVDGKTPLDYVDYELNRTINSSKGTPLESKLNYFRKLFIDAGAKRKSELCAD